MITLPALLASGFPPLAAVGTNKLQSAIGTGAGIFATMTPPAHILRHPINALRRLVRYRPLTTKIRQEFSLP